MVKLEGGAWLAPTVEFLVTRGVPVCGHIGLQPQSVNALGGYRVQGKTADAAAVLLADAQALVAAGPAAGRRMRAAGAGRRVTRADGAGHRHRRRARLSGQVLVLYDALGIQSGRRRVSSAIS